MAVVVTKTMAPGVGLDVRRFDVSELFLYDSYSTALVGKNMALIDVTDFI